LIRLSTSDLARLGRRAQEAAATPGQAQATPRRRRSTATEETGVPRGGRMARTDYGHRFITMGFDLAPQPKERARTFADDRLLARAFAMAQGDSRRFMAAIKARGEGGIMRSVTPDATRRFEDAAALMGTQAMAAAGLEPFTCPLEILVAFRFEGNPLEWPTGYADGDLDNLEKALKDAMNRVAYQDDRLIVAKISVKTCAAVPGISMTLRPAPPDYDDAALWEGRTVTRAP
jgi:Holliday junction resolvase RusA-like endonuclease